MLRACLKRLGKDLSAARSDNRRPARSPRTARPRLQELEPRLAPAVTILDPKGVVNDEFGYSVSSVGSDVLVGAPGSVSGKGSVYRYSNAGAKLTTYTNPDPGVNAPTDEFGTAVASVGTKVIVGANAVNAFGAVYLYNNNSGSAVHTFADPRSVVDDQFALFARAHLQRSRQQLQ
jgi:hypothetical protein